MTGLPAIVSIGTARSAAAGVTIESGVGQRLSVRSAAAILLVMIGCGSPPGSCESLESPFSGTPAVQAKATGFFRTAQIHGRWWLTTPDGRGLLSAGMNHVDYKEDHSAENVRFVTEHLRNGGFNTID